MKWNSEGGVPVGPDTVPVDELFESHFLNIEGRERSKSIGQSFSALLGMLATIVEETNSREWSLVKTKLQEACFFARRAMALQAKNQEL